MVTPLLVILVTAGLAIPADALARDSDGDGLGDRFERKRSKTSPTRRDTDRDGLSDRTEIRKLRTSPRRRDTDRDTLGDRYEVRRSHTDPRKRDTDGDGHSDGIEVGLGSDPLDAASPAGPASPFIPLGPILLAKPAPSGPVPSDTAPPDTTIDSGPPATSTSRSALFSFSASETATFHCRRDAGSWTRCSSPRRYSGLSNGPHVFEVRATDAAGNVDLTPATWAWIVQTTPPADTDPPETTISSGPSGTVSDAAASFAFGSDESGSTFQCRIDGGAWGPCTSPRAYSGLGDGSHTFDVRAIDPAGNTDGSPASRTWTVDTGTPDTAPPDTAPPDTSITAGPSGTESSSAGSFSFSSTEAGSSFECRLDGAAWSGCSSPKAYSGLTNASHTFEVRATDAAGNTDPTPASRTWTVDVPPPPPPPPPGTCSTTVSSGAAAQTAVSGAQPGDVVCMAAGTYGKISLSATKAAPGVTLRPANPGQATVGGITMSGQGLSVERFVARGDVTISARSQRMSVRYNDIDPGGGFGVFLYGDNGVISTVEIVGNRIHGTITDGIRLHNFRGVAVEGNEITGVHETGSHNDVLQTVHGGAGLVFRRNYVHDNNDGQGFFVKDGAVTNVTVEDNLFVRDPGGRGHPISFYDTSANPADPFYTGHGALVRRNTVWHDDGQVMARGSGNSGVLFDANVVQRPIVCESGSSCSMSGNVVGGSPAFVAPGSDAYRIASGSAGVTWRPGDQHHGP